MTRCARSHPQVHRMDAATWTLLVALSVLWGGAFFLVGVAVHALPPFTIVACRVAIAALALWCVLAALRIPMPRARAPWCAFLAMGVLNNVIPFGLFVWGQQHIASGLASILNATTPLFTVVVAHLLTTDERLTPRKGVGVVLGLGGVAVMLGADLLRGVGTELLAQAACLAAALSYACAGVLGRRFARMGVPPLATATGQVSASSLIMLPVAAFVETPWRLPLPAGEPLLALAALGLLSTALAYVLYFRILSVAGATNVLLVTFLIPVSAVMLGMCVLGEHFELRHVTGMALIGAGLAAIDGRIRVQRIRAWFGQPDA